MKLSRMMLLSLAILPFVRVAIAAEGSAPSKPAADAKLEVIELAIRPAQPPRLALRYSLLPGYLEQTPGNAVPIYAKAFTWLGVNVGGEKWDKIRKWLDTPLESLPRGEVRKELERYSEALGYVDIAARRERCDWDAPVREEGRNVFGILLPEVQSARTAAWLVALRARLQIAEKNYDAAVASLRTGYAMARHVAKQPFLVSGLVGTSMVGTMNGQLQAMLAQPDVPNMYWAITALPHPMIDLRPSLEFEAAAVYLMFPEMEPSKRCDLSPTEWSAIVPKALSTFAELDERLRDGKSATVSEKEGFVTEALKALPHAKADLIAAGHPKEKVEAMAPGEAVLLDVFEIFEARRDDLVKWLNVPYWQAHEGMKEAEARIVTSSKSRELTSPAKTLLSLVDNAYSAEARSERSLAALRCVEAIRLYAAAHGGQLPATLDEIREVPIPINPVTGGAFGYRLEGEVAVLDADGPADLHRQQYRVRVVK
ncbi:MAG: hypothetical protein HQ582_05540 [Planctomycetes bacterium]|nr:hypothetical protein [Planctomycetota bacterium]